MLPCDQEKLTPWLTSEYQAPTRSRDKLKIVAVHNKSSVLMYSYKHLRNKPNKLNEQQKRDERGLESIQQVN